MDDERFQIIKKEYDGFYRSLLSRGRFTWRSTNKGFWGHAPAGDIYEAFKQLNLNRHKTFVDLGSGDGKVVHIAALFCERAVGIESDNELFRHSLRIQQKLKMPNVAFYNSDFYDHNIASFDAVFVYPDEPLHRNLEEKLLNELRGRLFHCGHHFHPQKLSKQRHALVNGTLVTVYSK